MGDRPISPKIAHRTVCSAGSTDSILRMSARLNGIGPVLPAGMVTPPPKKEKPDDEVRLDKIKAIRRVCRDHAMLVIPKR